jgi:hypothetical protein
LYLLWGKRSTAQTAVEEPVAFLRNNALTAEVMVASKDAAHLILKTDWAICLDRERVADGRSSSGLCQHPISICPGPISDGAGAMVSPMAKSATV